MVLTEQDYFDVFNDNTRLFNYTLLHLLREHSAVFVGLSLQDENLHRPGLRLRTVCSNGSPSVATVRGSSRTRNRGDRD